MEQFSCAVCCKCRAKVFTTCIGGNKVLEIVGKLEDDDYQIEQRPTG